MDDKVNHPSHYNQGTIEVIDIIQDKLSAEEFTGFCKGNSLKYVLRAGHKGSAIEDYKKAIWYLERLIEDENE